MEEKIYKTLNNYKRILEEKGYKVLYIGLYGSQNYNLQDELSDIDSKAIVLPSLHDIIFKRSISYNIETESGSIDVKDLLTFYEIIRKGNFSYLESIQTEYSLGDNYLKNLFSNILPNLKSIIGAMNEKRKALTHEYPSKKREFASFGCDPKQYHHIVRLHELLEYNLTNNKNLTYLKYSQDKRDYMIKIKREMNNLTVEDLKEKSDELINDAKNLLENHKKDYSYELVNLDDEINNYIEKEIKLELINKDPLVYAREYRSFNGVIPKKDLEKFPLLKDYEGNDVSYIITESLEII